MMGYRLDSQGSISGRGKIFVLLQSIQNGFGTQPASYPMEMGALCPGVKQPGHETKHSPPSSAEIKNGEAVSPLPHTSP
jgi:hypothetical protein